MAGVVKKYDTWPLCDFDQIIDDQTLDASRTASTVHVGLSTLRLFMVSYINKIKLTRRVFDTLKNNKEE